jgi:tetratricopeptide (TPR) repeat protein
MSGAGKTLLATEYVHRFQDRYADVCWCDASTTHSLVSGLARLAGHLNLFADGEQLEEVARSALRYLANHTPPWLLVYDGVTEPKSIIGYLPKGSCHLLVTSLYPDWSEWTQSVHVDPLPLDSAVELLNGRSARREDADAISLATELDRLPLALDHAAAYCNLTGATYAECIASIQDFVQREPPADSAYPLNVYAAFSLAIDAAAGRCAGAEWLMAYLAQCSSAKIPLTLLEGAFADSIERSDALGALAAAALLRHETFDNGDRAVTTHSLVQIVARIRSKSRGSDVNAAKAVIARLAAIFPEAPHEIRVRPLCDQLLPHVIGPATAIDFPSERKTLSLIFHRAGDFCLARHAYDLAAVLLREAVALRERTFGFHLLTALSMSELAQALLMKGDPADAAAAQEYLDMSLMGMDAFLGPSHPQIATMLTRYADLVGSQGDIDRARRLYDQALKICETNYGPAHLETADILNRYASLGEKHRIADGVFASYSRRALDIRLSLLGEENIQSGRSFVQLGSLAYLHGEVDASQELILRGLGILERLLGPNDLEIAHALELMAGAKHAAQLAPQETLPLMHRALTIRQKTMPVHHLTAKSLHNIGSELARAHDFDEAIRYFRLGLQMWVTTLGWSHSNTYAAAFSLTMTLSQAGRYADARAALLDLILRLEKGVGKDAPLTWRARGILGHVLVKLGADQEGLELAQEALLALEKNEGSQRLWKVECAFAVVSALVSLGRPSEAEPIRATYGIQLKT